MNLNPNNIMFKSKDLNEIVLLDLEIYKDNEPTTMFGLNAVYCPPEIKIHNISFITSKVDIFSFGMFFFLNLFG